MHWCGRGTCGGNLGWASTRGYGVGTQGGALGEGHLGWAPEVVMWAPRTQNSGKNTWSGHRARHQEADYRLSLRGRLMLRCPGALPNLPNPATPGLCSVSVGVDVIVTVRDGWLGHAFGTDSPCPGAGCLGSSSPTCLEPLFPRSAPAPSWRVHFQNTFDLLHLCRWFYLAAWGPPSPRPKTSLLLRSRPNCGAGTGAVFPLQAMVFRLTSWGSDWHLVWVGTQLVL